MPPQSSVNASPTDFDAALFGKWLRMLLVAFYSDDEVVVMDQLLLRSAQVRDIILARALALPERQVRQILERRLLPDGLIERQSEGEGMAFKTYYRISHACLAVTATRLQNVEDSLNSQVTPEYQCTTCKQAFDSLTAMSFNFRCRTCNEPFVCGEAPSVMQDRLWRFRNKCKDLLVLTRRLRDMPIPHFPREERAKAPGDRLAGSPASGSPPSLDPGRPRGASPPAAGPAPAPAPAGPAPGAPAPGAPAPGPAAAAAALGPAQVIAAATTSALGRQTVAGGFNWFEDFLFEAPAAAPGSAAACADVAAGEDDALIMREAMERIRRDRAKIRIAARFRDFAASVYGGSADGAAAGQSSLPEAQSPIGAAVAGTMEDSMVTIQGNAYALSEALADQALQDSMRDDEYEAFAALARDARDRRLVSDLRRGGSAAPRARQAG